MLLLHFSPLLSVTTGHFHTLLDGKQAQSSSSLRARQSSQLLEQCPSAGDVQGTSEPGSHGSQLGTRIKSTQPSGAGSETLSWTLPQHKLLSKALPSQKAILWHCARQLQELQTRRMPKEAGLGSRWVWLLVIFVPFNICCLYLKRLICSPVKRRS